MALNHYINSDYIHAVNKLRGRSARRKVVAYVESFDDVLFWSNLLRPLENDRVYFEVMLPSRTSLCKGKKTALANRLGPYMIACVDADYDYLMQGAAETSHMVCRNPYVFHTYTYAIENYQCWAPALHQVCVMTTLNDHRLFDFEPFLTAYSVIVWPLFAWNIWAYRYGQHTHFSMLDFYHIVTLDKSFDFYHPERTLESLRHRVNAKIARLQRRFPQGKRTYKPVVEDLRRLGVTPETTYLFMRGHDVMDGVVGPVLQTVCDRLRREREHEIQRLAEHSLQMQNELAAYQHAAAPVQEMLRKHTAYVEAPLYEQVRQDIMRLVDSLSAEPKAEAETNMPAGR